MRYLKRIVLATMLLALSATSANAAGFRFGIKAGVNIDKLHLSNAGDMFDSNNRAGFTGGVMTEFQVPIIGLCFDASLMYSRMNSQYSDIIKTNEGFISQFTSKGHDFFNIPINVKYKIGLPIVSNFISPYIFTGPDFAFKLHGKDSLKTFQCAWNLGIGVELIKHLQISGGYSWGMNNIMKKTGVVSEVSSNIKAKNNYWTITAAYLF